jgi:transketolase
MTSLELDVLEEHSRRVRRHVVQMVHRAHSSHAGTSLSATDLLVTLYFRVLNVDPSNPVRDDRDRFILSKGHGAAALYAVLAERGFFPVERLDTFCLNGGQLHGHVDAHDAAGVELSTGSLGHGLPVGAGMALAARHDGAARRVFVLLSDGECDEGSVWEAALFAAHNRLNNLVAIVDYNRWQAFGRTAEVLDLEPFAAKWRAFGWAVEEVDGHRHADIAAACGRLPFSAGRPNLLLAHTVKGRGVSFMEDQLAWHYRSPNDEQLRLALSELER